MRVVILMSTYQGELFITEQLESILNQLPENGRILIRDDGSTDQTIAKIEVFQDYRIFITRGQNLGFVKSFFALLDLAPDDADMIMLSDQDDVWLPDKILRAQQHLEGHDAQPTLYCSRLRLVDRQLHTIGLSPAWGRSPSFQNALTENIVTGCTAALNRAALLLARRHGDSGLIYFHDWWLYLLISAFGKVIVDPEPTILYRQHGSNAIGMGAGIRRYIGILRFLRRQNWIHIMFNQIENLRTTFGNSLSPENTWLLNRFFKPQVPMTIVRLLTAPRRFRQSFTSEVLFKLLLLHAVFSGRGLQARSQPKKNATA